MRLETVHSIGGRLRLKGPALKNPVIVSEIRKALCEVSCVGVVSSSIDAGSLVINYNAKAGSSADIIGVLARDGFVVVSTAAPDLRAALSITAREVTASVTRSVLGGFLAEALGLPVILALLL